MGMMRHYPVARTTRRITYKFQTHDVRIYSFEDAVDRARRAVTRAGGELRGGVYAPPKHIKRWCVNRSPHVNKTSREHFWMVSHRRVFRWDAGPDVDVDAPLEIASVMPPNVAIRVTDEQPGLMCLKGLFNTLQAMQRAPDEERELERESSDVAVNEEATEGRDSTSVSAEEKDDKLDGKS